MNAQVYEESLARMCQVPSLLWMDNQSAIAVSKNLEHYEKIKYLSLCLFWLRDAVQHGLIAPKFVGTQNMAVDIFTKLVQSAEMHCYA
jgi:hypothetical protein